MTFLPQILSRLTAAILSTRRPRISSDALLAALLISLGGIEAVHAEQVLLISTPVQDSLEIGRTVSVEIRASEPLHDLKGSMATATGLLDVTKRFRSAGPDGWRADLRVGKEVRLGVNHLFISAVRQDGTRAHAARRFIAAESQSGLVRLSGPKRGPIAAPVVIGVHLLGAGSFRAALNGHDIRVSFAQEGSDRAWEARLTAHDGLRFGPNQLVITGISPDGAAFERLVRHFVVRADQPLVDAGPDLVGRVGTPVPLDGGATQPAPHRSDLLLHWRLVSQPDGSGTALLDETSVRPGLVPDLPGRYRIELTASHSGHAAVSDLLEVSVQPNAPPSGIPVETIVSAANPGVQVGETFYPMGAGGWLQMVVLDRQTLAPNPALGPSNRTYGTNPFDAVQLDIDVSGLSSSALVILSGNGGNVVNQASDEQIEIYVVGALYRLGFRVPRVGSFSTFAAGSWSLIGTPGLPAGQAYQFFGLQRSADVPVGDMRGFFQLDSTGQYVFTWPPEFLPFDTQAPGSSAAQTVVSVAGQQQSVGTNSDPGFAVFWYDADALSLRFSNFYPVCDADFPQCMQALVQQLTTIAQDNKPALVFVVSNNRPSLPFPVVPQGPPVGAPGWPETAAAIKGFGGNPAVVLGLDGSGDYALVGLSSIGSLGPNQGVELSQIVTGAPTSRITGLLTRNRQGLYQGQINAPPDGATNASVYPGGLQAILAQPAEAFPAFASPAEMAAVSYIAAQLGLTPDPTYGIRGLYWLDGSAQWDTLLATLDNLSPCTESPCDQGFGAVRSQLSAEFAAVSQVRGFFTGGGSSDLNGVIQHAYTDTSLGFTAITSKILALYNPPPSGTQAFGPLQIINAALSIASGLTGAIPDVGSAISGGFEVTQTILGIIEATSGSGGVSAFDPSQFEGDVYNLGTNLEAAFNQGINRLSHVADLLVSDWGRLQAANAKILTPGTEGGWGLDTTSQGRLTSQLQTNLAAYVWQTLLPVPLTELRCPDNKCAPPPLDNFPLVVPAPNEPDFVQVVSALLLTSTFGPPDQETMNQLFGSGGLGLQPPYFLAPAMTDSKGNRLTPGFSCNQNVPVIEPFKPCD